MDSITQATLGAAIGEALLGEEEGYKGALAGAVVATIPDLDVGLHLFYDSFAMLSIHRGYSHSIGATILGAGLIAFVLQRGRYLTTDSYKKLCVFSWLVLFTHVILDAFTAYGTQLFLPFSDERFGWDSINVVDPVYTVPMLVGLFLSVYWFRTARYRAIFNKIALGISTVYLLGTLLHKQAVNRYFEAQFAKEKLAYNKLMSMPVGIANLQWYGVARNADTLYLKKFSYLAPKPSPTHAFAVNEKLLDELADKAKERMIWFAKGFYVAKKVGQTIRIYNLQVDMRGVKATAYGKVPTLGYFELTPLPNGSFVFSSGTHHK